MLESRGHLSVPAHLILVANCWPSGLRPASRVLFGSHGKRLLSSPGALHRLLPPEMSIEWGPVAFRINACGEPDSASASGVLLHGSCPHHAPCPLYPPAHPAVCLSFATAFVLSPSLCTPSSTALSPTLPAGPMQPPHTGGPGSVWLTG